MQGGRDGVSAAFLLPGYSQHVIKRGDNRHVIFADDAHRAYYRCNLVEACARFRCRVRARVFMTNHVHLLMTPDIQAGIGKVMQSPGRRYVQYFKARYRRTGTFREGRYRATLLDSDAYLLTCWRYIELTRCVQAWYQGQVNRMSSCRCNALGEPDALITPHDLYLQLDSSSIQRHRSYRALFERVIDAGSLAAIREATNEAWVLGDDRFRLETGHLLQRQASPGVRGGDRKLLEYTSG
jgi:putative transposase